MPILTTLENVEITYEIDRYLRQSTAITDVFRRERAKAAGDVAALSIEVQALAATTITALYNQTAPTISP